MYKPGDKSVWAGRLDKEDSGKRWHQLIQCIDLEKGDLSSVNKTNKNFGILGFQCDEGVKLNKGRVGAAKGPDAIRTTSSNFACHYDPKIITLFDCGNVFNQDEDLESLESKLAEKVTLLMNNAFFPLILGGGHEVAYGGYKGVFDAMKDKGQNVAVINFDAHFDLRDIKNGINSGTPFLQISELCKKHTQHFNYMCLGIQTQSNTESLFRRANQLGVSYVLAEDMHESGLVSIEHTLLNFINKVDWIYLTVDMDVFDASVAPGVSAPAVPGVDKQIVFQILKGILASKKVVACDIAETNPEYDIDNRTAKLAAYILHLIVNT
jgi:formiminoglutamase